jgi:hypothetical protein
MKKVLKFTAIGLVIFAVAANLHTAIFSFYGISTNNLEGAVWAQSTSTSTSTSGNESSSSGEITWWDDFEIPCTTDSWTNLSVTVNAAAGVKGGFNLTPPSTVTGVTLDANASYNGNNDYALTVKSGTKLKCERVTNMTSCFLWGDDERCTNDKVDKVVMSNGLTLYSASSTSSN